MATVEDKYVITFDATNAKVALDSIEKKVAGVYKGIATLKSVSADAATGVRSFTYEISQSKLKVEQLTAANKRLASSWKSINNVRGKFSRTTRASKSKGVPSAAPSISNNTFGMPTDMAYLLNNLAPASRIAARNAPKPVNKNISMPGYVSPSAMIPPTPRSFGIPDISGMMNTLSTASRQIARTDIAKRSGRPGMYEGIFNPASSFRKAGIDSVGYGSSKFIPKQQKQTESRFQALNKRLQPYNKAIFQTQMATLGVAFSFMSLQNSVMGAVQSLTDLGGNVKATALGKSFTGVDILGSLDIDYKTLVDGWKAITGILSLVQSLMVGIISKALTPDIVKAITSVIAALAAELGKPEVVKALQQLVLALIDLVKSVIPIIVPLSNLVVLLGESGLLKVILGVILSASILLPLFSLIGGAFTVFSSILTFATPVIALLTTVVGYLATALGLTGAGLGAVIAAIGIVVLLVVGTIVNAFAEFQKTGDIVKSIIFGFIDTFGAFVDAMGSLMNMLLGWTGRFNYVEGTATRELKNMMGGYSNSSVVNNYNINGDVFDTASLQTAINKTKGNQGVTY